MNLIDPLTLQLAIRALDAAGLRQQAIAQNIANANVPGARPVRVLFEQLLGELPAHSSAERAGAAIELPQPQVVNAEVGTPIELDQEMADMSSNSLHYQALVKAIGRELAILNVAVQEVRR